MYFNRKIANIVIKHLNNSEKEGGEINSIDL